MSATVTLPRHRRGALLATIEPPDRGQHSTTLKSVGPTFGRSWFNQGAPRRSASHPPHYGVDGDKVFGIHGTPDGLTPAQAAVGAIPFHTFWGPMAGLACTQWIARCARVLVRDLPDLTLAYLPHLVETRAAWPLGLRHTAAGKELDDACAPILDAAKELGARVWVVSEYGHCDVSRPLYVNRILRREGLLAARVGPFGEQLDTFSSRAFAVCDHQVAHVYVRDPKDVPRVRELIAAKPGVARLLANEERGDVGLDHARSGELVVLAEPDAWFAYPFWLDDNVAPDYARTVAIHHKPGYDPCELFLDPALTLPKLRVGLRLAQKARLPHAARRDPAGRRDRPWQPPGAPRGRGAQTARCSSATARRRRRPAMSDVHGLLLRR